jgi:hypothetical protein
MRFDPFKSRLCRNIRNELESLMKAIHGKDIGPPYETFEKYSSLFKFKEGENFNHPRGIGFAFHRAGRNTFSILRIKI